MELECIFAGKGCKYVGARSILREHVKDCPFDLDVECQYWSCGEMVSMEEMTDHLKAAHQSLEIFAGDRKVWYYKWTKLHKTGNWRPKIVFSEGSTFFLHAMTEEDDWMLWVVLLGTEEDANKYEVIMSIKDDQGGLPLVESTGKVFHTDKKKKDFVLEEGKLHLNKEIAENVASQNKDGNLVLKVYYNIISK